MQQPPARPYSIYIQGNWLCPVMPTPPLEVLLGVYREDQPCDQLCEQTGLCLRRWRAEFVHVPSLLLLLLLLVL
jgi:hypothetical protein